MKCFFFFGLYVFRASRLNSDVISCNSPATQMTIDIENGLRDESFIMSVLLIQNRRLWWLGNFYAPQILFFFKLWSHANYIYTFFCNILVSVQQEDLISNLRMWHHK